MNTSHIAVYSFLKATMYLNCIYVSQDIAECTFYYILVYSILNRGIERWLESYNIDELSMAKYC